MSFPRWLINTLLIRENNRSTGKSADASRSVTANVSLRYTSISQNVSRKLFNLLSDARTLSCCACYISFFFHFWDIGIDQENKANGTFPNGTATSTPSSSFIESKRNLLRFKRNFLSSLEESLFPVAVIGFASLARLLLKCLYFA